MITFEDKFPSLYKYNEKFEIPDSEDVFESDEQWEEAIIECCHDKANCPNAKLANEVLIEGVDIFYELKQAKKALQDYKQKVREAIDKIREIHCMDDINDNKDFVCDEAIKELGLEEK